MKYFQVEGPKLMQGDPLKRLRILGLQIFQSQYSKTGLTFLFLLYGTLILSQIFVVLSFEYSVTDIIDYGPLLLMMCFMMLAIFVLLYKNRLIEEVMEDIDLWSIDLCGPETEIKIMTESTRIVKFVFVNYFMGLLWAITFFYQNDMHDSNLIFVYNFFKNLPKYRYLLGFLFKATFLVSHCILPAHIYQFIYATTHLKFQMYLQNIAIKDMVVLESGENYHNEIERRLKIIIDRHKQFLSWNKKCNRIIYNLIVPFIFGGYAVGISIALSFIQLSNHFQSVLILRTVLWALYGFTGIASLIASGQALQDESEKMSTSLLFPLWYTWNIKNKKTLLMILTNTVNPLAQKLTNNISINFDLGIKIFKVIHTVVSVFVNIR